METHLPMDHGRELHLKTRLVQVVSPDHVDTSWRTERNAGHVLHAVLELILEVLIHLVLGRLPVKLRTISLGNPTLLCLVLPL